MLSTTCLATGATTGPPTSADNISFDQNSTYEAWWDGITGDREAGIAFFNSGDVTLKAVNVDEYKLTANQFVSVGGGSLTVQGITLETPELLLHTESMTIDGDSIAPVSNLTTTGETSIRNGGTLNLINGGTANTMANAKVGFTAEPDQATVNVQGTDSHWEISGELQIGELGSGLIQIFDGGTLVTNGARLFDTHPDSKIIINGPSSQWTNNGESVIHNELRIENEGSVFDTVGSVRGSATVTGAGSLWNSTGNMNLIPGPSNTLEILDGARVETGGSAAVALIAGGTSTVSIEGVGSEWQIDGFLTVGLADEGVVNVTDGGKLTSNDSSITGPSTVSRVSVEGAGSVWANTGSLDIERRLFIRDGAEVAVAGATDVQTGGLIRFLGGGGILDAVGGLTNNSAIQVNGTSVTIRGNVQNSASLSVDAGNVLTITDTLTNSAVRLSNGLAPEGTVRIEGSYNGGAQSSFFSGDPNAKVILAGEYRPESSQTIEFANVSLEMENTNTTFIQLGSTSEFSALHLFPFDFNFGTLPPNLTLAGNLQVDLINGFTLDADQSFQIIDFSPNAGVATGAFANFADGDVVLSDAGFDLVIRYDFDGQNDDDGVYLETEAAVDCVDAELTGDKLTVTGTFEGDVITLSSTMTPGQVSLIFNDCPEEIFEGVDRVTILGMGGDDIINAEFPGVAIDGGGGNDEITVTGLGGSTIFGDGGNDVIVGGPGIDKISGGLGMDNINGMGGADEIYGFNEVDKNDTNQNILFGGDGNDFIEGTDRVDIIDGGRGSDEIFGFKGSDIIDGFHGNDFINAGPGADQILAGLGNDEVIGGPGNDVISGQSGQDMLFGGTGNDTISGGLNNDTIFGQGGDDVLSGNEGADTILGGTGTDELNGGTENDILNGQGGDDSLFGQAGDDEFMGGAGFDLFNGGQGVDTAVDTGEAGEVSIEN